MGKYKGLTSLYVEGVTHELRGGHIVWLQSMNNFELEEARSAAQAARARMKLALEQEDSDETAKFRAEFETVSRERVVSLLASARADKAVPEIIEALDNDPEWRERLDIIEMDDELVREPTPDEKKLLERYNTEYLTEVADRVEAERSFQETSLEQLDEESLRREFSTLYVDKVSTDASMQEYKAAELYHATRVCEAVKNEDEWTHEACGGHPTRLFDSKQDVRSQPDSLLDELSEALNSISMTPRQGKGSGSPASSSDSSPQPEQEEGSTPSTQEETPTEPLGT